MKLCLKTELHPKGSGAGDNERYGASRTLYHCPCIPDRHVYIGRGILAPQARERQVKAFVWLHRNYSRTADQQE
jgi:hypothetical protein